MKQFLTLTIFFLKYYATMLQRCDELKIVVANRVVQRDVTRDDWKRRFLAQHSVATLFQIVTTLFQHCSAVLC